jgi:hypothetical protein
MDPNYHSAESIFRRFRRALLTDDQPFADQLLARTNEQLPLVQEEFAGDLMEYEIFLFAGLLANLRQIQELKQRIKLLSEKLNAQTVSNSSNSSSSSS